MLQVPISKWVSWTPIPLKMISSSFSPATSVGKTNFPVSANSITAHECFHILFFDPHTRKIWVAQAKDLNDLTIQCPRYHSLVANNLELMMRGIPPSGPVTNPSKRWYCDQRPSFKLKLEGYYSWVELFLCASELPKCGCSVWGYAKYLWYELPFTLAVPFSCAVYSMSFQIILSFSNCPLPVAQTITWSFQVNND